MKKLLVPCISFFLFTAVCQAAEDKENNLNTDLNSETTEFCQDAELNELIEVTEEQLEAAPKLAWGNCSARTICPGGYPIYCYTYGPACTWNVQPGYSVSCTGYNSFGQWVNFFYTCY